MLALDLNRLPSWQRAMVDSWEERSRRSIQNKDASASCDMMVAHPHVNHVPVLTGGVGWHHLEHFFGECFIA